MGQADMIQSKSRQWEDTQERKRKNARIMRGKAACNEVERSIQLLKGKIRHQARLVNSLTDKQPGIVLKREAQDKQWELGNRIETELNTIRGDLAHRIEVIKARRAVVIQLLESHKQNIAPLDSAVLQFKLHRT